VSFPPSTPISRRHTPDPKHRRGIFALHNTFEMDKQEEELIGSSAEILNALIGKALRWSPAGDHVGPYWPHAVALVAVNAKEAIKLPPQDELVRHSSLSLYLSLSLSLSLSLYFIYFNVYL